METSNPTDIIISSTYWPKKISQSNKIKGDKLHIFWEGHKFLQNLHRRFVLCSNGQIYGGDFAKFCGLLRIYELYYIRVSLCRTGYLDWGFCSVMQQEYPEWTSKVNSFVLHWSCSQSSLELLYCSSFPQCVFRI